VNPKRWLTLRVVDFLTRSLPHYERRTWNDPTGFRSQIRKGDVMLVEGDSRVAAITKYLTQSSWSHLALYIGDELVRHEETREATLAKFGDDANRLMIEALPEGVVAVPADKYLHLNIRVLRPYRLRAEHLQQVLDEAIAALGWHYDLRNIVDLMRYFALLAVAPARTKNRSRFGSRAPTEVICSSLIGQIFHHVGFPILPRVEFSSAEPHVLRPPRSWRRLWSRGHQPTTRGLYYRRHPTMLTPRDFDLSPYFEVVKFNIIAGGGFDYRQIRWAEEDAEAAASARDEGNPTRPNVRRAPEAAPLLRARGPAGDRQKSLKVDPGRPKQ
jgi:hypothetical protein